MKFLIRLGWRIVLICALAVWGTLFTASVSMTIYAFSNRRWTGILPLIIDIALVLSVGEILKIERRQ